MATRGLIIAAGIALQNIPEGMVIIAPMLSAGISQRRTFLIAASTGAVEVVGTLIGYFAVTVSQAILPDGSCPATRLLPRGTERAAVP